MKGGMAWKANYKKQSFVCKLDKSLIECRLLFFIRGEAKLSEL